MSTPTLGSILNDAIAARLASLRVALPARVISYDAATCKASVQPLIAEAYVGEDGAREVEPAPVIEGVPVIMPGSGGVRVKFPIAAGDPVLLVFASSAIDRWLALGGTDVDPVNDRHHQLTDAIAIPGIQSFADAADANPIIEFTGSGQIHAGGSSALALQSELAAIRTWLSTHTHPSHGAPPTQALLLPDVPGTTVLKGG